MPKGNSHPPLNVVLWGWIASQGLQPLRKNVHTPCRFWPITDPARKRTLPPELARADVVVGSVFTEPMARATPRLKLLQSTGAGVDGFCLNAISPHTTVANAYFHGPAIGEYVMMMILALNRDLMRMDAHFRRGVWYESSLWGAPPPAEIQGKTLGLIGYGHIGKEVAARARAFGMKVWVISAHPPARKPKHVDSYEGSGGFRDLLRAADYLVIACPLNEDTRGLIGKREFGLMKRTACLINVARGPVVEEEALYHALQTHRIQGAAIDVWYQYPKDKRPTAPSRFPFHKLDNILMTPHVAGWMKGTQDNRFKLIAANIDRLAAGQQLENVLQGPHRQRAAKAQEKVKRQNAKGKNEEPHQE
ncbi:MAG: 2-hydroxyacid dehydrogenase [Acidobacteriota bacterium]|nr:2-hydroxyacid dehydrogenase [Acidobacteriota bacterium]